MNDNELAKWFWELIQDIKYRAYKQQKIDGDFEDWVVCPDCDNEFKNIIPVDLIEEEHWKSNTELIDELEKKFLERVEFRSLVDL